MTTIRLALAQVNTTVGDLAGNEVKICEHVARARKAGADVVAFPELTVTGSNTSGFDSKSRGLIHSYPITPSPTMIRP